MKIHVNRVPSEGLHAEAQYEPKTLDIDRTDLHVSEPISVAAFVTKAEDTLVAQADIQGRVEVVCARCLIGFVVPLQASGIFTYQVEPTDVVDLTEDIRQEILLAYPMIPVCTPDCKGLCRRCGQNLNERTCACEPTTT